MISILKLGNDPAEPNFYRPISLLDMIDKFFEKIMPNRILHQLGECGLLRDEQFRFRSAVSTTL